jgi:hypothetical protein
MSIKYWISSGESEQFENCKNEVQLFDRLDEEFKPLRERLGDLIFVDEIGNVFSVKVAFMLVPESVQMVDDNDIEIIATVACEGCLSENVDDCGVCLDCGHINHCPPTPPRTKLTSGRSH